MSVNQYMENSQAPDQGWIIMPDAVHHVTVITQGDTELAPIHQYNVAMYSEYSHTCLWKRTCMTSFVLPSRGSGVLLESKGY